MRPPASRCRSPPHPTRVCRGRVTGGLEGIKENAFSGEAGQSYWGRKSPPTHILFAFKFFKGLYGFL